MNSHFEIEKTLFALDVAENYLTRTERNLCEQYDLAAQRVGTSSADFDQHLAILHAGKVANEHFDELFVEGINVFSSKYN